MIDIYKQGNRWSVFSKQYSVKRGMYDRRDAIHRVSGVPPTTDHRPPTTDHRPPTTDHRPPTTDHRPPTTDHRRPTTEY